MQFLRVTRGWTVLLMALALIGTAGAAAPINEYQIKAVFLFNFVQFVEWPPGVFAPAPAPVVVGVLGEDPFGPLLDEAVRGEKVAGRPLLVRRFRRVEDVEGCHVLFICDSEVGRLDRILGRLAGRGILTVGESEDFARRGGMIRMVTENNRVRLRINPEAARQAGLTISSKLLRPADIVGAGKG